METTSSLKRRIMHRVYLSYGISIFTHRFFLQGVVFGAAVAVFGRLVHVASVTHNLLDTPLGQLPQYIAYVFEHALLSGEVMTVAVTFLLIGLGISAARAIVRTMLTPVLYRTI